MIKNILKENGMTLIVLVVTIMVLIILTVVVTHLTLVDNIITNKVKHSKQIQDESLAREKLESVLLEANVTKQENVNYNSQDFLNEILENNAISVDENKVIVDNYVYLIDRQNLTILENLGEAKIQMKAEVDEYLGVNEYGNSEINMFTTFKSDIPLKSILIKNPNGTTFEIFTDKVILAKDLTMELDKKYEIIITKNDGTIERRVLIEKTEENIRTVEELVAFRDKVNSGLTYEGKKISILNDLDLSEVCGEEKESWEPIGKYISDSQVSFKGNFDGKNHKISNLYINATADYQGLFASNGGIIQNIILENVNITNTKYCTSALVANSTGNINNIKVISGTIKGYQNIAGIVAGNDGGHIENCENRAEITYGSYGSGTGWRVGGIVGFGDGIIKKCINYGSITGTYMVGGIAGIHDSGTVNKIEECVNHGAIKSNATSSSYGQAGGIVGVIAYHNNGEIINCYNTGTITAIVYAGGLVGLLGYYGKCTITNCYNVGSLSGSNKGGIIGLIKGKRASTNTYYLDTCGATDGNTSGIEKITREQFLTLGETLGEAYIDDEEILDEEGTGIGSYKYNNGYPILRWQIGL